MHGATNIKRHLLPYKLQALRFEGRLLDRFTWISHPHHHLPLGFPFTNLVFISGAAPPKSMGALYINILLTQYLCVYGTISKEAAVTKVLQNNINLSKALTNFCYNYILVVT
jgi:hypothetical protein